MQSSACLMPSSGCSFTSSAAPQQCAAASLRWHVHPGGERGPGRTGLGVPGRARPEWRPARSGSGPAGNIPRVPWGLGGGGEGRALRSGGRRTAGTALSPGTAAPRGTNRVTPAGARRWGHPPWGHPRWGRLFGCSASLAPELHLRARPASPR